MCSSAIRSSSSIVTPGCRWSPTRWMVSWTTSPAFAISSISRGDLRMIIRTLQHVLDLRPDGVDRLLAVDGDERAGGRVVVDHGPGQLVVEREALLDRLGHDVAGGDVGKAVLGLDPLGLCPLPRALRTKEENPHYFKNPS